MTTQLPRREQPDTVTEPQSPDVLFEEARRRRRRRWLAGSALTAAALAAVVLILGIAGGGGGSVAGHRGHGQPSGSGASASSAHANTSRLFPGAPATQHYGVSLATYCPLAPRNRYLPAGAGCVTARVADLSGNGRLDLVLTYSRLNQSRASSLAGNLSKQYRTDRLYQAEQAMLRVVTPAGAISTAAIPTNHGGTTAAALISIAHVNDEPGNEIFLQVQQISSGATAVVYSLHDGRLIRGPYLSYGRDSGAETGFNCLPSNPPRLIQRRFLLISPVTDGAVPRNGIWKETKLTYAWHGPRLVKIAEHTSKRHGPPSRSETGLGASCIKGIG